MTNDLDHWKRKDAIAWQFDTAQFTIALVIEPEDMDSADSFQFQEDIDAVRNGAVEWFQAGVLVFGPDGEEIASDWLGGCAYDSVRDFITAHRTAPYEQRNTLAAKAKNTCYCHYFPSMVVEALHEARRVLGARREAYAGIHG